MLKVNNKHDRKLKGNRKKLFLKFERELGPLAFNSWKLKL